MALPRRGAIRAVLDETCLPAAGRTENPPARHVGPGAKHLPAMGTANPSRLYPVCLSLIRPAALADALGLRTGFGGLAVSIPRAGARLDDVILAVRATERRTVTQRDG